MVTNLVTGCAGFIGMHVADALLKRGDTVVGIDNLNDYYDIQLKKDRLDKLQKYDSFTFYKQDFAEGIHIDESIDKICHLGAQAGVRYSLINPQAYEHANNKGTLELFEFARKKGIQEIVFASSSSVYGNASNAPFNEAQQTNPISVYAATKLSNEILAQTYHDLYGMHMIGLRFFTVYGPWGRPDMAPYIFTEKILKGEQIEIYNNGKMQRDFTYIGDIVSGVVSALDNVSKIKFEIINLARGEEIQLMDFVKCVENATKKDAQIIFKPLQQGDVLRTSGDITKAKKLLGYNPKTSIQEGIQNFVEWYKEYHHLT